MQAKGSEHHASLKDQDRGTGTLDTGDSSVQRWTLKSLASNACRMQTHLHKGELSSKPHLTFMQTTEDMPEQEETIIASI